MDGCVPHNPDPSSQIPHWSEIAANAYQGWDWCFSHDALLKQNANGDHPKGYLWSQMCVHKLNHTGCYLWKNRKNTDFNFLFIALLCSSFPLHSDSGLLAKELKIITTFMFNIFNCFDLVLHSISLLESAMINLIKWNIFL